MTATNGIPRAFALLTRAPLFAAIAWSTLGSIQTAFAAGTSTPDTSASLVAYAQQQAQANGLDPGIFVRQIEEESGFNPSAFNVASGASGIAQIVPAGHPNVNPWDPQASISYAAQLDATYLRQFGRYDLMLAAYNAGPAVVAACRCVPPYPETQKYVRDILGSASAPSAPSSSPSSTALAPASGSSTTVSAASTPSAAQGSASTGRRQAAVGQRPSLGRGFRSGRAS